MKSIILRGFILAVIIIVFFAVFNRTERSIPGTILFENRAGLGISIADFFEADDNNRITFSARTTEHGILSTNMLPWPTTTELIYANVAPELHMLTGVFPRMPDMVAISDTFAVKRFFSTDILGVEVIINNKPYSICGVFREETLFLSGKSNNETVYLHLSAHPNKDTQITQFWVRPGNMLPREVLDRVSQILEAKISAAETTNYRSLLLMTQQSKMVLWFVAGLCAAILLVGLFLRFNSAIIRYVRETSESAVNVISKKLLIWQIILSILCLASAVAIVWFISFEPVFPFDFDLSGGGAVNDVILLYAINMLVLITGLTLVKAILKHNRAFLLAAFPTHDQEREGLPTNSPSQP